VLAAATEGSSHLDALWPAVAAIVVAIIGLAGNIVLRRRSTDEEEDTNVITALASALAAEKARADAAEIRATQCEAREQARRRR
jgi:hypothetical protein